jgi:vancomycin resistance protein YoaR
MKLLHPFAVGLLGCLTILGGGLMAAPLVFAEHVLPGVYVADMPVGGVKHTALHDKLLAYQTELQRQEVTVQLRQQTKQYTLGQLGIGLDIPRTIERIERHPWAWVLQGAGHITPVLSINEATVQRTVAADFKGVLQLPQNATLTLTSGPIPQVTKSRQGEGINIRALEQAIVTRLRSTTRSEAPLQLEVSEVMPAITEGEIESARALTERLLRDGLKLTYGEQSWDMKPFTIRRVIRFVEQSDPEQPGQIYLGVAMDETELTKYLEQTLAAEINRLPQDARFEIQDERVTQFALPQNGQALDMPATLAAINEALRANQTQAALTVHVTEPQIKDVADSEALGIKELVARGESDFAGSPRNRIHNITVGAARYHGLLIPPGAEVSFNQFLGPVTAEAGFKPELVIKHNVTIPEFGGGLCQVSTTMFRAAVQGGMPITQRRNHAYAVRYYGTPGFDATIYPPSTDLKFTNDTPGYILIQTRIEGTKLFMEFWGTSDGREVEIVGPRPYDRQPDGAVKATLAQRVMKDGEIVREDTFYSRYKSPNLFPKILNEQPPLPAPPTTPTPTPAPPKP